MVKLLRSRDSNFLPNLEKLLAGQESRDGQVTQLVRGIIEAVRTQGNEALLRYTKEFDRHQVIQVTPEEIKKANRVCSSQTKKALKEASKRIQSYHKKQMPKGFDYQDKAGVRLGNIWRPIDSVGIYVPGGSASYPSSVLMNAIPALVAGVSQLSMVVPAPDNKLNPAVLVAADMLGITNIYKIGGAQAVAALAYGTETITKVDKIIGPGNRYVAEAKRQLFGTVGIDMVAGPSEVLIVSDSQTPPIWAALDLLAQAEHDVMARSILVTDHEEWAEQVIREVDRQVTMLPRGKIAQESWEKNGLVIIVDSLEHVAGLINRIAPEHLQLALDDAPINELLPQINHAGAIFMGRYTPEAVGDYIAGPSHVLPTSGTARFSSGLSVYDFLKRISLIGCSKESLAHLAGATSTLATEEGLEAHALTATIRC